MAAAQDSPMKLARVSTAFLLTFLAAGPASATVPGKVWAGFQSANTPAQESRTPSVVIGTKEERAAKAAENYAQNRPVEAALGFEGLWKDFPAQIDFLFNAAASRFAAGHFAHAAAYTRDYLAAPSIGADDRKEAEAQLREALAQTTPVSVTATVERPAAGRVTIVAQHVPRESGDVRPELLFTAAPGAASELQLDPGVWIVRGRAEGHMPAEQQIEVRKGQATSVPLRLALAPVETKPPVGALPPIGASGPREVPPEVVRRNKLGFGIAGGVAVVAGVGIIVAGSVKAGKTASCSKPTSDCVDDLASGLSTRAFGTLALGAGLGLAAGGLTWFARDAETRKKAWIAEAVVGGVGLIVGLALTIVEDDRFTAANYTGTITNWQDHRSDYGTMPVHALGSTFLGFGGGALISSFTGLFVQRKHRQNVGVSTMSGRGQMGLVLSGRF